MRTRADVLAELYEVRKKKPNSYASNMHKVGKINELERELREIETGHQLPSVNKEREKKIEFVVEGLKITIEHL
ncbi:hypothetical protein MRN59_02915 [Macrococcoides caseolyticum]|uniref:hypothetical protein n=1 Tax=Macrococcoides caseolyticum TaxID=69966 RepID=UPI002DB882A9|nr:hypothetical protein [Macrococcus caseolyticus]MEB8171344.1 hypothetical protein [Macrococcus caseolyticus]